MRQSARQIREKPIGLLCSHPAAAFVSAEATAAANVRKKTASSEVQVTLASFSLIRCGQQISSTGHAASITGYCFRYPRSIVY